MDQNYAEVDRLAQEKLKIAERLAFLIQRARTRLDYDLRRVLILQGDDPGQPAFVSTSRNPVQEINDSLRLAIAEAAPIVPPAPVVLSAAQAPAQKSALYFHFIRPTTGLMSHALYRAKGCRDGSCGVDKAAQPRSGDRACPSAAYTTGAAAVTSGVACAWTPGSTGATWAGRGRRGRRRCGGGER
jgi:hypothetical protein